MPRPKKNTAEPAKKPEKRSEKTFNRLLGMKDLVGAEYRRFDLVVTKAWEFAKLCNFMTIKTPLLESFDLYKKSTRKNTDHEFYFVEGEKTEKVVLRPEITQGVIRAYLENNFTIHSGHGTDIQ